MARGVVVALAATACVGLLPGSASATRSAAAGRVVTASSTISESGNQTILSAVSRCPKQRAQYLVGGGFLTSAPTAGVTPVVYESQKVSGNHWRVSAQLSDPGPPDAASLKVFAYCRKNAPKIKNVQSTATSAAAGAGPTATATCTGGAKAIGGGFSSPPPVQDNSTFLTAAADSLALGKTAWQARVISFVAGASVTSYAYCAKGKVPKPVTATSPALTGLLTASPIATCTGKVGPVNGGFSEGGASELNFVLPFESERLGKTWKVSAAHAGTAPAGSATLSSIAYCG